MKHERLSIAQIKATQRIEAVIESRRSFKRPYEAQPHELEVAHA